MTSRASKAWVGLCAQVTRQEVLRGAPAGRVLRSAWAVLTERLGTGELESLVLSWVRVKGIWIFKPTLNCTQEKTRPHTQTLARVVTSVALPTFGAGGREGLNIVHPFLGIHHDFEHVIFRCRIISIQQHLDLEVSWMMTLNASLPSGMVWRKLGTSLQEHRSIEWGHAPCPKAQNLEGKRPGAAMHHRKSTPFCWSN